MFLVRDIMYCRPGQVRQMVQKFTALSKLAKDAGMGNMRIPASLASLLSAVNFCTICRT